jgi:hypothetical protein
MAGLWSRQAIRHWHQSQTLLDGQEPLQVNGLRARWRWPNRLLGWREGLHPEVQQIIHEGHQPGARC